MAYGAQIPPGHIVIPEPEELLTWISVKYSSNGKTSSFRIPTVSLLPGQKLLVLTDFKNRLEPFLHRSKNIVVWDSSWIIRYLQAPSLHPTNGIAMGIVCGLHPSPKINLRGLMGSLEVKWSNLDRLDDLIILVGGLAKSELIETAERTRIRMTINLVLERASVHSGVSKISLLRPDCSIELKMSIVLALRVRKIPFSDIAGMLGLSELDTKSLALKADLKTKKDKDFALKLQRICIPTA
jgi:hypothetical protein